ncbi:MAG: CoA pyrophosphatase [Balneolales bacterium]
MHPFLDFLKARLNSALPGKAAQRIMAPVPYREKYPEVSIPLDASQNAVLVLFSTSDNETLEVLYTLRSTRLLTHKGQISFPGGRTEKDETPIETALRETHEEVGVESESVSILGALSPLYVPPSNNIINPVAGFIKTLPELRLQEAEVSEAFTISLDDLITESRLRHETWLLRGKEFKVPYWNVHTTPLWGATAMITSEVIELYREYLQG